MIEGIGANYELEIGIVVSQIKASCLGSEIGFFHPCVLAIIRLTPAIHWIIRQQQPQQQQQYKLQLERTRV